MDQLNSDLQRVLQALATAKKHQGQLAQVEERLTDRSQRLEELRVSLDKEREDVRKLEGVSLASIYHTILSSKTEQLDKERAEVFRAKLAYDQCHTEVGQLKATQERIQGSLAGLGNPEQAYAQLLQRKEALLLSAEGSAAETLLRITEQHAGLMTQLREIDEATAAGNHAFRSLDELIKSLAAANTGGPMTTLEGIGLAAMVKRSHLDKAKAHAEEAQEDLFCFETELRDIQVDEDFGRRISNFERYASFLLDGLIFDWLMQSRIRDSRADSEEVQMDVRAILEDLATERLSVEQRLVGLDKERERCIADA